MPAHRALKMTVLCVLYCAASLLVFFAGWMKGRLEEEIKKLLEPPAPPPNPTPGA